VVSSEDVETASKPDEVWWSRVEDVIWLPWADDVVAASKADEVVRVSKTDKVVGCLDVVSASRGRELVVRICRDEVTPADIDDELLGPT
jgi:putative methionine-R-sulfoxide reductase with GAF domain